MPACDQWPEPGEPLSWVSSTGSQDVALENLGPLCLCFPCSLEQGSAPGCLGPSWTQRSRTRPACLPWRAEAKPKRNSAG